MYCSRKVNGNRGTYIRAQYIRVMFDELPVYLTICFGWVPMGLMLAQWLFFFTHFGNVKTLWTVTKLFRR